MVTRVYVNVDQEPFCAELVFPKGLDVGGFVSLVFGPFGQERVDGDHSQRHLSLRTGSKAGTLPVQKKVFISVPYGERQPLCTLRDAPLPDDLEDIPDVASDEDAVDDLILGAEDSGRTARRASSREIKEGLPESAETTATPTEVLLCSQCTGWFANAELLQIHRAMSHTKNPTSKTKTLYGCKVCRKTYSTSNDCLRHKWKHRPESEWPFQCETCHRGFIRQSTLARHQQSHTLNCRECTKTFEDEKSLHEHNLQSHRQQERETFLCVHCEQMFLSKGGLLRHIKRYHEVREEPGAETSEGGDPESLSESAARLDAIPVAHSCHMCTFGCSQAHDLAQHIASAHPAEPIFRCEKCEQPFLKEEDLQEHWSHKHQLLKIAPTPEGDYVCQICQRKLKTFSGYWGHMRGHSKARPFQCDQCGQSYTSRGSLTKHKRTHDLANVTKCPHCFKEFATLDYMRIHERLVHKRDFKHPCRLCGHRFPNERKMQTHMAVVHEQELSSQELAAMTRVQHRRCPDCPFATYSDVRFRQHRASHTGEYPFACTQCTAAFAFRFQLTHHTRRYHCNMGPLACPNCPRCFTAEDAYATHLALHEAPHAQDLNCADCGRLFETPRLLDRHRRASHAEGSPFVCSLCSKRFRSPRALTTHLRALHSRHPTTTRRKVVEARLERQAKLAPEGRATMARRSRRTFGCTRWPFNCQPCGKFFKFEGSLRAHRVCFHGIAGDSLEEKPCPECGKTFQTELSLSMHLRTHTKEISFKCVICRKVYRSRCSLKKHIATVHRANLHCFCPVCGKGFLSGASLARHAKFGYKDGCKIKAVAAAAEEATQRQSEQTQPEKNQLDQCPDIPNQPDMTQPVLCKPDLSHLSLNQPEQRLTQLSTVSEACKQAAMEQLLASVQPCVESAQHVLQMLSAAQVEEVGLGTTPCPDHC